MSINVKNSEQPMWIDTLKGDCFKHVHLASKKKTGFMRASCLAIGTADCLLTIAKRVSLAVESPLKGLLNIVGSLDIIGFERTKNCSFQRGLKQIFIEMPKHVIIFPFTVVSAGYHLVNTTIGIARDPEKFALQQWKKYGREISDFKKAQDNFKNEMIRKLGDINYLKKNDPLALNIHNRKYWDLLQNAIIDTNKLIESQRSSFKHPYDSTMTFEIYFKEYIQNLEGSITPQDWKYLEIFIPEIGYARESTR